MTSAPAVVLARVVDTPLDVDAHLRAVVRPDHGAIDVFVGSVRDHDAGVDGVVVRLEYEAHPDATAVLAELAHRVAEANGATIAVSHRSGVLGVGDLAVVIAASAAHRAAALSATRELIEAIKTDLPIWKRQTDDAGATAWVGIA